MIMSRKIMNTDSVKEEIKVHSFSSTLLEAIYRSIDREERSELDTTMFGTVERKNKKQSNNGRDYYSCSKREEIEKWMEKRTVSSSNGLFQSNPRRQMLEANRAIDNKKLSFPMSRNPMSSSSHSSDHSSISVEREYHATAISKIPKSKSTNSGYQIGPNYPIRAVAANDKMEEHHKGGGGGGGDGRSINHFVKTKSHALKFYKELKKMKQPISPGGRIATLINSLFVTGHSKKAKYTNVNDHHHHEDNNGGVLHHDNQPYGNNIIKSTCSSASSISRSCLSHKTSSSSSTSSTNKVTRSVRFSSPYNPTVLNEQKSVKIDESCDVMANDHIQTLLRKYHNEDLFAIYNEFEADDQDHQDDDEDEVSSCDSSDLFELDHYLIGPVGIMEAELPVYETTTLLDANRPIANSLFA